MRLKNNKILRDFYRMYQVYNSKNKIQLFEKNVILIGTPTHGNLGDQAISVAEIKFLKEKFPDYNIIEIFDKDVYSSLKSLKRQLKIEDKVFFHGGGNFGSLYSTAEEQRRIALKILGKRIPIFFFPQSIYYEDTLLGKKQLQIAINDFKKYPNLTIVAREKISFEFALENFNNHILLIPDIVLSLDLFKKYKLRRKKRVVFSFRDDKEKLLDEKLIAQLKHAVKDLKIETIDFDTHIGDEFEIREEKRNSKLNEIWDTFGKSSLILTDRLHGMIFALITGTPAIIFSNNNPKIRSSYETWITDVNYIRYIDTYNPSEVIDNIVEMLNISPERKNFSRFYDYFAEEINAIQSSIEEEKWKE